MRKPRSWWQVDDVPLMQPIGFIWFTKPRYRVKAVGRKTQGASSRPERD